MTKKTHFPKISTPLELEPAAFVAVLAMCYRTDDEENGSAVHRWSRPMCAATRLLSDPTNDIVLPPSAHSLFRAWT
jgi:hypothetical protein